MTRYLRKSSVAVILACFSMLLTACGFQLRGLVEIPQALQQLAITTPEKKRSEIAKPLKRHLQANGVEIVPSTAANYQLEILEESHTRRAATLSASADIDEYELTSKVVFLVRNRAGDIIINDQPVSVERTYDYDADNQTASNSQEALLRNEMYQQLASQIVRFYTAINPDQEIAPPANED
ncbi:MAG: LPS assembly lipoprotein LptE [Amphritea sp.]